MSLLKPTSKTLAVLLVVVSLWAAIVTGILSSRQPRADYYVCNYNIGLALQEQGSPSHWDCVNASGYYSRVAACYYQGSGGVPREVLQDNCSVTVYYESNTNSSDVVRSCGWKNLDGYHAVMVGS